MLMKIMKMHKVEILIKDNKWKKEISDIENLFSIYFNTIFNTFKKFKKKKTGNINFINKLKRNERFK